MTAPYVGLPTVGAGCAYFPSIDTAACGAPPTVHLLVVAAGWGGVALAACGTHAEFGRSAGEVLGEHPHSPGCAVTYHLNTHWTER